MSLHCILVESQYPMENLTLENGIGCDQANVSFLENKTISNENKKICSIFMKIHNPHSQNCEKLENF